jgi:hypothetical protein
MLCIRPNTAFVTLSMPIRKHSRPSLHGTSDAPVAVALVATRLVALGRTRTAPCTTPLEPSVCHTWSSHVHHAVLTPSGQRRPPKSTCHDTQPASLTTTAGRSCRWSRWSSHRTGPCTALRRAPCAGGRARPTPLQPGGGIWGPPRCTPSATPPVWSRDEVGGK